MSFLGKMNIPTLEFRSVFYGGFMGVYLQIGLSIAMEVPNMDDWGYPYFRKPSVGHVDDGHDEP